MICVLHVQWDFHGLLERWSLYYNGNFILQHLHHEIWPWLELLDLLMSNWIGQSVLKKIFQIYFYELYPCIWGLWSQKAVSQARISNCIPQYSVVCNYLSLPRILASGTKVLIYEMCYSFVSKKSWLLKNIIFYFSGNGCTEGQSAPENEDL